MPARESITFFADHLSKKAARGPRWLEPLGKSPNSQSQFERSFAAAERSGNSLVVEWESRDGAK
jgi:hypothetical protein